MVIFALVVGGMIFLLNHYAVEQAQEGEKILPAQVEKIIDKVREFPEEKILGTFEKFVPEPLRRKEGKSEIERKAEQKIEELVEEIKALPEEQLEEIKREVFCTEVCEEVCQEVCE